MVEKFVAIRDAYKEEEKALLANLEKVRVRIGLFDQMIAEEGGVATASAASNSVEKKESDIIEIHL